MAQDKHGRSIPDYDILMRRDAIGADLRWFSGRTVRTQAWIYDRNGIGRKTYQTVELSHAHMASDSSELVSCGMAQWQCREVNPIVWQWS